MQSIRTINDIEGWHHSLNRRATGRHGLTLCMFVAPLHKEASLLVSLQIRLVSAYLSNTVTNLCIEMNCILLYYVVLNWIVLLIYCSVDMIQNNAGHKCVGALENLQSPSARYTYREVQRWLFELWGPSARWSSHWSSCSKDVPI